MIPIVEPRPAPSRCGSRPTCPSGDPSSCPHEQPRRACSWPGAAGAFASPRDRGRRARAGVLRLRRCLARAPGVHVLLPQHSRPEPDCGCGIYAVRRAWPRSSGPTGPSRPSRTRSCSAVCSSGAASSPTPRATARRSPTGRARRARQRDPRRRGRAAPRAAAPAACLVDIAERAAKPTAARWPPLLDYLNAFLSWSATGLASLWA